MSEERERIARIIDPGKWRVLDSQLEHVMHSHRSFDLHRFKDKESLAKADAILALSPPTGAGEAVAWRWQTPIPYVGDGTRWGWSFASHPSTPPASLNAEPLYAHPPAGEGLGVEERKAAIKDLRHCISNASLEQPGWREVWEAALSVLARELGSLRPSGSVPTEQPADGCSSNEGEA